MGGTPGGWPVTGFRRNRAGTRTRAGRQRSGVFIAVKPSRARPGLRCRVLIAGTGRRVVSRLAREHRFLVAATGVDWTAIDVPRPAAVRKTRFKGLARARHRRFAAGSPDSLPRHSRQERRICSKPVRWIVQRTIRALFISIAAVNARFGDRRDGKARDWPPDHSQWSSGGGCTQRLHRFRQRALVGAVSPRLSQYRNNAIAFAAMSFAVSVANNRNVNNPCLEGGSGV